MTGRRATPPSRSRGIGWRCAGAVPTGCAPGTGQHPLRRPGEQGTHQRQDAQSYSQIHQRGRDTGCPGRRAREGNNDPDDGGESDDPREEGLGPRRRQRQDMSEAGRGKRQNGRGDGVPDVQRPPDGQQRRRHHVEIEHTFTDEDPDNGDQRGDHGTGRAARPQSTNVHDAVRPRGRRNRCSHGSTPMLAEPPVGGTSSLEQLPAYRHRLLRVSRRDPEVRRRVRRPFRCGRPLSTSAARIHTRTGNPARSGESDPGRGARLPPIGTRPTGQGLARNSTENYWRTSPDTDRTM
jgi:hypothetical protein